ncbi:MAG: phage tail tape measure [Gallionellaceae bacterium]|nr:MAG: phage tail tape measure [Gallionellaceae bacterium]
MATGAIELKLIFSAGGAGGVAASIGSMTSRMEQLTKASVQTTERMNAMGLSVVDSFVKEKAAVVAATKAVETHRAETTRMGKSLAEAKGFQNESTQALKDYRAELAQQDTKTTDEQRLKLQLLRDQASGAEKDVKTLTKEFDKQREKGKELSAELIEQTRKVQALREEMNKAGINTAKLGEERGRLRRQMEQEQRTLDKLTARYQRLIAVQKDVTKYKAEFNDRKMNAVAAVGVGASLAAPVAVSAQFEDKIRQISITGELYKEKGAEAALAAKVREAATKNGVSHDNVAAGVERLVAQGMDAKVAASYSGMLAKVAKATRADMGDLAELVYTLQTKFKLKTEGEIFDAINVLAKAGKLGQYEIKAMAKAFPELGGAAASFGSTGMQGVKEMGALMQTMRAGSGSASEAETYMRNWFSHMSSNSTQDNFKSVGIEFEKAKLAKVIASKGKTSNVEASFMVFDDYINKVVESGKVKTYDKKGRLKSSTDMKAELAAAMAEAKKNNLQGDALTQYVQSAVQRVGLSSVMQDMQATQAYLAWMTGKGKYRETRDTLDTEGVKGTIDRDLEEQNRLTTAQWERMKVSLMDLGITIGNVLSPAVGHLLGGVADLADKFNSFATEWPNVTSALVVAVGGVAAFTSVLLALGAAASLARLGVAAGRSVPFAGRIFGSPGTVSGAVAAAKGSVAAAGGGLFSGAKGMLAGVGGKLLGGASKLAMPLAVGASLFQAGSALANDKMGASDKFGAVGGAAGSLAGGLAGAKLGALVGTAVFPGVGTLIGGALGGVAGSIFGDYLGGKAGKALAGTDKAKTAVAQLPKNLPTAAALAADKKSAPIELKLEYKPQIVIHGDPTPQTMQKFGDMLRAHQSTLEEMMRRTLADQQRRAF